MARSNGFKETARYVLVDLPSSHEIEDRLATECEIIAAILANHGFGDETRHIRAASVERFSAEMRVRCSAARFVHLSGHGDPDGLEVLGGTILWRDVAEQLKRLVREMKGKRRYLTLSCCYSRDACTVLRPLLRGYFTGIYHFTDETIGFANAMSAYTMFYMSKVERSAEAVVDRINDFFGTPVLMYHRVERGR